MVTPAEAQQIIALTRYFDSHNWGYRTPEGEDLL
jgi:hypothetical protein